MIARVLSAGRGSALAVLLTCAVACNCSGGGNGSGGTGAGPAAGGASDPRCEQVRPKIEALYRAEAAAGSLSPERTEEMVKDNTAMVMNECAVRHGMVSCASSARTSLQLEADCMKPLDDEGSEGTTIRR